MELLNYYDIKKETIDIEFKRFCLNYDLCNKYNDKEIKNIITTGKWSNKFSNYVNDNICNYIYCVLPKYISTFLNTNIDGKIIFGVDDDGIITGIPINKNLTKKRIASCINKTINDNIKTNNNKKDILNNINVNIKKVNVSDNISNIDISDIMYKKYQNDIRSYNNKMNNYIINYNKFMDKFNKYRIKLNELLNDINIKEELISYIDKKCLLLEKKNIINYLKNNNNFNLTTDEIINEKNNNKSYIYWLINFKDYMLQHNLPPKPTRPNKPKIFNYMYILTLLTPMINKFLSNGINYYVIEIFIKSQKNLLNDLMYINKKGFFVHKKRYLFNNKPFTS